jgi:hypothetical protein
MTYFRGSTATCKTGALTHTAEATQLHMLLEYLVVGVSLVAALGYRAPHRKKADRYVACAARPLHPFGDLAKRMASPVTTKTSETVAALYGWRKSRSLSARWLRQAQPMTPFRLACAHCSAPSMATTQCVVAGSATS